MENYKVLNQNAVIAKLGKGIEGARKYYSPTAGQYVLTQKISGDEVLIAKSSKNSLKIYNEGDYKNLSLDEQVRNLVESGDLQDNPFNGEIKLITPGILDIIDYQINGWD